MVILKPLGLALPEDLDVIESRGRYPCNSPMKVGQKARAQGAWQLGTLGSGNHYVEVQVVDQIFDEKAASAMGIKKLGQVCVMVHCGSRGLGHKAAEQYIERMLQLCKDTNLNDNQLAYAHIKDPVGQDYLQAMWGAANYAFVNRSVITKQLREVFSEVFGDLMAEAEGDSFEKNGTCENTSKNLQKCAYHLDMHLVYDVSHNIATLEKHPNHKNSVLVHRKGSTRALPPGHPELPACYKEIGQPVLVGGSMGTYR